VLPLVADEKLKLRRQKSQILIHLVENTMLVIMSAHITVKISLKKNNCHYILSYFALFYVNLRNSNNSNDTVPLLRK